MYLFLFYFLNFILLAIYVKVFPVVNGGLCYSFPFVRGIKGGH